MIFRNNRNAVLVAGITSISLILACGGGNSQIKIDDGGMVLHSVNAQISSVTNYLTNHQYVITGGFEANKEINPTLVYWNAKATIDGISADVLTTTGENGKWNISTEKSGKYVVFVTGGLSSGSIEATPIQFTVQENPTPHIEYSNGGEIVGNTIEIEKGGNQSLRVDTSNPLNSGNTITWNPGDATGTFITGGGNISIASSILTLKAGSLNEGKYSLKFDALETGSYIPIMIKHSYNYNVEVVDGHVVVDPVLNSVTAVVDYLGGGQWNVKAEFDGNMPSEAITWTPSAMFNSSATTGLFTLVSGKTDQWVFEPKNMGTYNVGVTGTVGSITKSSAFVPITLKENTLPKLDNVSAKIGDVDMVVDAASGWTEFQRTTRTDKLVVKGSTDSSHGLSGMIRLNEYQIVDPDLADGDELEVKVTMVSTDDGGSIEFAGFVGKHLETPIISYYNTGTGKDIKGQLESIKLSSVPSGKELNDMLPSGKTFSPGTDRLYFHVDVRDRQTIIDDGEPYKFVIAVPTNANVAPVFDGMGTVEVRTPGDMVIDHVPVDVTDFNGWVDKQPEEGKLSKWSIYMSNNAVDKAGFVNSADPVRLELKTTAGFGASLPLLSSIGNSTFVEPPAPGTDIVKGWEIIWTPNSNQGFSHFVFTLNAYNKFGAASQSFDMKGSVSGSIIGADVKKSIYYFGDVTTIGANFSWDGVVINPFYDQSFGGRENRFYHEIEGDPITVLENQNGGLAWKISGMPPSYYYIGDNWDNPAQRNKIGLPSMSTNGWGNNGYNVFAYLNHKSPDLTSYIGSGRTAVFMDESLEEKIAVDKDNTLWKQDNLVGAANIQFDLDNAGFNSFLDENAIIQMFVPNAGQRIFINSDNLTSSDFNPNVYPVSYGWDPAVGLINHEGVLPGGPGSISPNGSFSKFTVELENLLPFEVNQPVGESVYLSTLVKEELDGKLGNAEFEGFPYWITKRTGFTSDEVEILGGIVPPVTAKYVFSAPTLSDKFDAKIDRYSFVNKLDYLSGVGTGIDGKQVEDTLRVLGYPSTIAIGPVENEGTPVIADFGSLRSVINSMPDFSGAEFENITDQVSIMGTAINGVLDLGQITLPRYVTPTQGNVVPIVEYKINYTFEDGHGDAQLQLPGSMGVMTADLTSPIVNEVGPVTNVRITTKKFDIVGGTGAGGASRNIGPFGVGTSVSKPGAGLTKGIIIDGSGANAPEIAKRWKTLKSADVLAFPGDGIVYLNWINPVVNGGFSGNIIEFFAVVDWDDGSYPSIDEWSVPIFSVHVGSDVTELPIWLPDFALDDYNRMVIRIRTVRYGIGNTMIDFNETPFKKAFPMNWCDVLTSWIDFSDIDT